MQQEVVLAMLAKEPAHPYQLRARLDGALGPLSDGLNAGHIYVTLNRLEKAGLVALEEPFHLKLIAAAAAGLADPVGMVAAQRRELLRRLREAQEAALGEPEDSDASLLLEGIALRLQADLRWLEACQKIWAARRAPHHGSER